MRLPILFAVLPALLTATPALTQTTSPSALLKHKPGTVYPVTPLKGKCPRIVTLWTTVRNYEGGAEYAVIANTSVLANTPRTIKSSKKVVEFVAPLKTAYASCIGEAKPEEIKDYYSFRFHNGYLYFLVKLPPDTPSNPSVIVSKSVINSRPYVRWQIAD